MAHTPNQLKITALRIDEQKGVLGLTMAFNQPISLNSKQQPASEIFLAVSELEHIIKLLRKDVQ